MMKRELTPNLPGLHSRWFRDNTEEEKALAKEELLRGRAAFKRLHEILDTFKVPTRGSDYDTPAWQFKLAHALGANEVVDQLKLLIDPIIRNENDR